MDDWLASDMTFHVIRDRWSHNDLMLPGTWGAAGGRLKGIKRIIEAHVVGVSVPNRQIYQQFLASIVWLSIRNNTLIHDDLFGILGARPFLSFVRLPDRQLALIYLSTTAATAHMVSPEQTIREPSTLSAEP